MYYSLKLEQSSIYICESKSISIPLETTRKKHIEGLTYLEEFWGNNLHMHNPMQKKCLLPRAKFKSEDLYNA